MHLTCLQAPDSAGTAAISSSLVTYWLHLLVMTIWQTYNIMKMYSLPKHSEIGG